MWHTKILIKTASIFVMLGPSKTRKVVQQSGNIQTHERKKLAGYPFAPPNTLILYINRRWWAKDKQIVYTSPGLIWHQLCDVCQHVGSSLCVFGLFQMCIHKSNVPTEFATHGCICCCLRGSSCQNIPWGRRRGTRLSDGCHCAPGRWRAWVYI